MNAGLFTALVVELKIPVKNLNPYEIVEHVIPRYKGIGDYRGHALDEVIEFFENVAVFRIPHDSALPPHDIYRILGFWTLRNRERIILNISDDTLASLEALVLEGATSVPFLNVVESLHAAHWQHAFLEAYRPVERLFAFDYIENLHKELAITVPLLEFVAKIEEVIGWRPKEDDAIERLCALMPDTASKIFERVKLNGGGVADEKMAKWIYKLRNSVVHFRPSTERINLESEHWDEILRATFMLVAAIYAKYDGVLRAA